MSQSKQVSVLRPPHDQPLMKENPLMNLKGHGQLAFLVHLDSSPASALLYYSSCNWDTFHQTKVNLCQLNTCCDVIRLRSTITSTG